ncbi:hypothetical protein MMC12_002239 [Toensbergia leucococca]|nr:hypothetical protein [Toensbergia leucococca]
MSGTGEERWRTARGQPNRQPSQPQAHNNSREHSSGSQVQGRQASGSQGLTAMPGNAWTTNERGNRDGAQHGPPHEQHISVRGFNAQETRDVLKKAFVSVSSEDGKSLSYRATGGPTNYAKSGGPWASKPNTMGNGKDFFLELRKQLSTLQQSGERAGG